MSLLKFLALSFMMDWDKPYRQMIIFDKVSYLRFYQICKRFYPLNEIVNDNKNKQVPIRSLQMKYINHIIAPH